MANIKKHNNSNVKTFYGRVGYEGVGQAKAVVFFILVAVIMLIQLKITRKKEVEN